MNLKESPTRLTADQSKTQEVEGLRFAKPAARQSGWESRDNQDENAPLLG
jgi:hypothetical protein